MNTIGGSVQSYQTAISSHTPLGKPAAGLESPENKDQTLPPVEESSASEKLRGQPNQKLDAMSSDSGGKQGQHASTEDEERQPQDEFVSIIAESDASAEASAAPASLHIALQRAAALSAEHHKATPTRAAITDSFSVAAGAVLPPGVLVDQRS